MADRTGRLTERIKIARSQKNRKLVVVIFKQLVVLL